MQYQLKADLDKIINFDPTSGYFQHKSGGERYRLLQGNYNGFDKKLPYQLVEVEDDNKPVLDAAGRPYLYDSDIIFPNPNMSDVYHVLLMGSTESYTIADWVFVQDYNLHDPFEQGCTSEAIPVKEALSHRPHQGVFTSAAGKMYELRRVNSLGRASVYGHWQLLETNGKGTAVLISPDTPNLSKLRFNFTEVWQMNRSVPAMSDIVASLGCTANGMTFTPKGR